MKRREVGLVLVFAFLLAARPGAADALRRDRVPEPLRPWVDWVLRGHEDAQCPFLEGAADRRRCAWPSELTLDLDEQGGRASQAWRLYREAWVPLPGDARLWPQEVRVDGKPAVVVPRGDAPAVRLAPGPHEVRATFAWNRLPELLAIPAETGLVALSIDGKRIDFPRRDPLGQLWLKGRAAGPAEEARLAVRVERRVTDEVPLLLATRIELRVSGRSREALLARALPAGFVPMALDGPLPARLEPDGRLRVQVRPGTWRLELHARHQGPADSLALPPVEGPWASEEVWVFDARPALRVVDVEGVAPIDPQQTELPAEWRRFPAYRMRSSSVMRLVEKRRGDSNPPPDQLSLRRTWWLDFDGDGYTAHDVVSGTLRRSWRLEMPPPMTLGRVAVGGRDRLITRGKDPSVAGVEIRRGELRLEADSRFTGPVGRVPAVGWSHDFQNVSAELELPPGWRLVYASGVDDVSSTWLADWTLLDLFLVLITALAAARIWGRGWGVLALVTLALTYPEPGAPRALWLALLAGEALLAVIPAGRLQRAVRFYRLAVVVALVLVAIPFMVRQVRLGMYPALERPWQVPPHPVGAPAAKGAALPARRAPAPQAASRLGRVLEETEQVLDRSLPGGDKERLAPLPEEIRQIDETAMVSTGPGLPRWRWNPISLGWRGPVEQGQQMRLVLLSPATNLVLALLRVGLIAALLLRALLGAFGRGLPRSGRGLATALALAVLGSGSAARAAEFPPADLLRDLEQRLLEHPECAPTCASSGRMLLEATATGLILRVEIAAGADTAVPLPGGAKSWSPAEVVLDGEPAGAMARDADGVLWLAVAAGPHQVVLDGRLPPAAETVDIPLPLTPRRVEARTAGWTLSGLRDDGVPERSLRLVREQAGSGGESETLERGEIPPFARLERNVRLGLSWEADNVLARLTPPGTALTVEVPLLPGESVTSPDVRVEGGKALVVLAPSAVQARWRSILEPAAAITLEAARDRPWTEAWRLDASPIWHVETQGIPPIHAPPTPQPRQREWRPWPGESVSIAITRPEGFPGQTLTVDHSTLETRPGMRSSESTLSLEIRSSRGAQHEFVLPHEAELVSVTVNGTPQPVREEEGRVTLPIAPGEQTIGFVWRSPRRIALRIRSPRFAVGVPSVNAETTIRMPADRWTLAVGGGRLGPAVLFWSLLFVVALAALALGRVRSTPLGSLQWFLLGVGLTQAPVWVAAIVAGWLLALGWRLQNGSEVSDNRFNWMQVGLALWTAAAVAGLFVSIRQGLLGLPEMQIAGNGSSAHTLRWFHDRAGAELPVVWVVSAPLTAYRLAMLAWALWIAAALTSWLRWGWRAFSAGGLWRASARGWRLKRA